MRGRGLCRSVGRVRWTSLVGSPQLATNPTCQEHLRPLAGVCLPPLFPGAEEAWGGGSLQTRWPTALHPALPRVRCEGQSCRSDWGLPLGAGGGGPSILPLPFALPALVGLFNCCLNAGRSAVLCLLAREGRLALLTEPAFRARVQRPRRAARAVLQEIGGVLRSPRGLVHSRVSCPRAGTEGRGGQAWRLLATPPLRPPGRMQVPPPRPPRDSRCCRLESASSVSAAAAAAAVGAQRKPWKRPRCGGSAEKCWPPGKEGAGPMQGVNRT